MNDDLLKVHMKNEVTNDVSFIEIPASEVISYINMSFVENEISAIASLKNGEMVVHTGYENEEIESVITVIDLAIKKMSEPYVN